MPQTRYVLGKALAAGLRILVVINKCDKPSARPTEVLNEVFDLFVDLHAGDWQLDFPVLYASGRDGWVRTAPDGVERDTRLLFEAIEEHVPPPKAVLDGKARIQVTTIDHNDFVGRIAIGRVDRGVIRNGMSLSVTEPGHPPRSGRVTGLFVFDKLGRRPVEQVESGDLCAIQGYPEVRIGQTLCDPSALEPLDVVEIDEPTLAMDMLVNDSPFAGREGSKLTGRQIGERLRRELRSNVALRVEDMDGESRFRVSGRGILHLGILVETMRREGFELSVSRPRVIDKIVDGERLEPIEELTVDVPTVLAGKVIEAVCSRRGELEDMDSSGTSSRLRFSIPARGLIGLRSRVLTLTNGEAAMHHILRAYEPYKGSIPRRTVGVIVSSEQGQVTAYALDGLQDRGDFFVEPAEQVYEGQVVGEHCKSNDITVNACREKKLTNMRASGSDRSMKVAPKRELSLEDALEYIEEDELVEVTPGSIRLRKTFLTELARKRAERTTSAAT